MHTTPSRALTDRKCIIILLLTFAVAAWFTCKRLKPGASSISAPTGLFPRDFAPDFLALSAHDFSQFRKADVLKYADNLNWVHRIRLYEDYVTPGEWAEERGFHIPTNLTGQTFLDIGSWDGYYTFLAENRGASMVTAVDYCCWNGREYGLVQKQGVSGGACCWGNGTTFQLAHAVLRSRAKAVRVNVYDLAPEVVGGQHDVVLFAGVLYHLRFPFLALTRVAAVTRRLLILETTVPPKIDQLPDPLVVLYPNKELSNDPTNWCAFNEAAVVGTLKALGFADVRVVHRDAANTRIVFHAVKNMPDA